MESKCNECHVALPCLTDSGICRECDHQFYYCFSKCVERCRPIREQLEIAFRVAPGWCPGADAVPNTSNMLDRAHVIAYRAHHGQLDKAGKPYILHPLFVESKMPNALLRIVALLHDVPEDSRGEACYSLPELAAAGFHGATLSAVDCLTKRPGEVYEAYLKRVKGNRAAITVKLADLEHNSDLSRLLNVTEADRKRTEKYAAAIEYLKSEEALN